MNTATAIIIFTILCLLCAFAGIAAAFYLLGINRMQQKMLVEAKRQQKRVVTERNLWQDVSMRKLGLGSLKPQPVKRQDETEKKDAPRVVTASQAVAELKAAPEIKSAPPVPREIKEGFFREVGELSSK